jgi:phenylpyruvate tautomerase PptA (4-oxalocrotonate tautomerase family)
MPLWNIDHPAGAFSDDDKAAISKGLADLYSQIPIPKFYVVTIFREAPKDSMYVGGVLNNNFIRFTVDHIARTLPGPVYRQWWMKTCDAIVAPYVKDKGFDWEISIDETPFDLWALQGELPPPFQSFAEKRWVEENKASPYTVDEMLPLKLDFAPGVIG